MAASCEGERNALGQAEIHTRGTIILAEEFQTLSSNARARKCENQMCKIEDEKFEILESTTRTIFQGAPVIRVCT